MKLSLTVFRVQGGMHEGDETSSSNFAHHEAVGRKGVKRHQALAHVQQALCYARQEEVVGFLGVVAAQVAKHTSDARVVGTGSKHPETQHCVLGNYFILRGKGSMFLRRGSRHRLREKNLIVA